jgi:hypothetical protein
VQSRERYVDELVERVQAYLGPQKPRLTEAERRAILDLVANGDIEVGQRWSRSRPLHLEDYEALREELAAENPSDADLIRSIPMEDVAFRAWGSETVSRPRVQSLIGAISGKPCVVG